MPARPVEQQELEYLRPHEIDACRDGYRPLAKVLVGSGARISEALAVRWHHRDLGEQVVRIQRQRDRAHEGIARHDRQAVLQRAIGPALCESLTRLPKPTSTVRKDWLFLCPTPLRGRYADRTSQAPPHRRTVQEWHEAALEDAGLRTCRCTHSATPPPRHGSRPATR